MGGVTLNAAAGSGSGAKSADGGVSGDNGGAWDFALTGAGDVIGVDGVSWGIGYGEVELVNKLLQLQLTHRKMTSI